MTSRLTELIARAPWREAVTYRDTWPHEYVLSRQDSQQELLEAVCERFRAGEGVSCRFFRMKVLEELLRRSFPGAASSQVLDAIPFAELIFWPKLSPPPCRPQREGDSEPDVLIRLGGQGLVLVESVRSRWSLPAVMSLSSLETVPPRLQSVNRWVP